MFGDHPRYYLWRWYQRKCSSVRRQWLRVHLSMGDLGWQYVYGIPWQYGFRELHPYFSYYGEYDLPT